MKEVNDTIVFARSVMKPTVKILSMQRVKNHGSFLQSFALKQLLCQKGAAVDFIDIRKGLDNHAFLFQSDHEYEHCKKLSNLPARLWTKPRIWTQNRIFGKQAVESLGLSPKPMTDEHCDLALIGSDEVFNCSSPASWGLSLQLFGDIPDAAHVASYAASCGHSSIEQLPDSYRSLIAEQLKKQERLSVRDRNSLDFVLSLCPQATVEEHLDPVLIYDFSPHIQTCPFKKKFLLLYSYNNRINRQEEIDAIRRYAKQHDLQIVCAGCFQYWCRHNIPVSSMELLSYFQAADCIVTDTFHGSILSIVFRKRFVAASRSSNQNKLVDLLSRLAQEERHLKDWALLESVLNRPVNYKQTEEILLREKARSERYLSQLLQLAQQPK